MVKEVIKKFIPKPLLLLYHKTLAILANLIYGFPSRKLIVIGVTGTKGKSSTVLMIVRILEEAGYKVGSTNTIFFKITDKEWPNNTKQGMPGRFRLQKMLRQMVKAGCTHAVIEVTSEGIVQSRHWGIAFAVAVFTNLSPEHIEAHGSYEKYREAKGEIFRNLSRSYGKVFPHTPPAPPLKEGGTIKKVIVINGADPEADYFLQFEADEKYKVKDQGEKLDLQLLGEFMRQNALLALAVGRALGITDQVSKRALAQITSIPGRAERIEAGQDFTVLVDYAHEPLSFTSILKTGRELAGDHKLIALFGVTGGGRDTAKRPVMGRIASQYTDYIILTTDDPYDDDPQKLIDDIVPGIQSGKKEGQDWWRVVDRQEAIRKALSLAKVGDVVLLLGKGSEQVMAVGGGKKVPWSDEETVRELLAKPRDPSLRSG